MNMSRGMQVWMLMSIFLLGLAAKEHEMDTCGEAGSPACSTKRVPEKAETQLPKLLQVGSSESQLSESSHRNKQEDTITTKKAECPDWCKTDGNKKHTNCLYLKCADCDWCKDMCPAKYPECRNNNNCVLEGCKDGSCAADGKWTPDGDSKNFIYGIDDFNGDATKKKTKCQSDYEVCVDDEDCPMDEPICHAETKKCTA